MGWQAPGPLARQVTLAEAGQGKRKRDEGRLRLSPGEEPGVLDHQLVVQWMPMAQLLLIPALEKCSLWGFTSNF